MAQKREQIKKKRQAAKTEGAPKTEKSSSKANKKEELIKRANAVLEEVDALLRKYANDSRPKKASPHVHLCDGTKIDLRKLIK